MNEPVKAPGMFLIGLPESTLNLVQSISQKTGQSIPEIVSFAIGEYAHKVLALTDSKANSNLNTEKRANSSKAL